MHSYFDYSFLLSTLHIVSVGTMFISLSTFLLYPAVLLNEADQWHRYLFSIIQGYSYFPCLCLIFLFYRTELLFFSCLPYRVTVQYWPCLSGTYISFILLHGAAVNFLCTLQGYCTGHVYRDAVAALKMQRSMSLTSAPGKSSILDERASGIA